MIRVGLSSLEGFPSPRRLRELRAEFEERCFIRLPGFLPPAILGPVQRQLAAAPFGEAPERASIVRCDAPKDVSVNRMLGILLHDPPLLRFVAAVSGQRPIRSFASHLIRFQPGAGHYLYWHNDLRHDSKRRVALTVNLSDRPFRGGALQFRWKGRREPFVELVNDGPGDAVLFKLDPRLYHRNTPVEGEAPKTTFAGWFYSLTPKSLAYEEAAASQR